MTTLHRLRGREQQVLQLSHSSTPLYPPIRHQNSQHHCHLHRSLQTRLLQLTISSSYPPTAHWTSTGLPSRTSYHPALCFSSSVIFLLVDACVGLNWILVSFLSHVNKKHHSFIHDLLKVSKKSGILYFTSRMPYLMHNSITELKEKISNTII